jgi:hypothetical protein
MRDTAGERGTVERELRTVNGFMTGEGSRGWDGSQRGEAGLLAYCEREGSRPLGGTSGKIIPFASGLRETRQESICFLRGDDIHSRLEAIFELTLIAAGVVGVIAGLM